MAPNPCSTAARDEPPISEDALRRARKQLEKLHEQVRIYFNEASEGGEMLYCKFGLMARSQIAVYYPRSATDR